MPFAAPLTAGLDKPQNNAALMYYKRTSMSVEIMKKGVLQKVRFPVKDKVGLPSDQQVAVTRSSQSRIRSVCRQISRSLSLTPHSQG